MTKYPFKIHNDPTLAADGYGFVVVIGISCNFNQLYQSCWRFQDGQIMLIGDKLHSLKEESSSD